MRCKLYNKALNYDISIHNSVLYYMFSNKKFIDINTRMVYYGILYIESL